jgi:hypothetical protein
MPFVRSRVLDPTGSPRAGRRVTAHLVASSAFLDDRTGQVLAATETSTDSDGYWQLTLTATGDLEALDAHYLVREYAQPGEPPALNTITVPDDEATHLMRDLLVVIPDWPGWQPVAKPTVTGSRDGNTALTVLLAALANVGIITDSTTP